MKKVELTGSPKDAGFKTKASLLEKLEDFGYSQSKMKKRGNDVDILLTDDPDSKTKKMELAKELGVEIMTYDELADLLDLERDI